MSIIYPILAMFGLWLTIGIAIVIGCAIGVAIRDKLDRRAEKAAKEDPEWMKSYINYDGI